MKQFADTGIKAAVIPYGGEGARRKEFSAKLAGCSNVYFHAIDMMLLGKENLKRQKRFFILNIPVVQKISGGIMAAP